MLFNQAFCRIIQLVDNGTVDIIDHFQQWFIIKLTCRFMQWRKGRKLDEFAEKRRCLPHCLSDYGREGTVGNHGTYNAVS